jgi:hypothetical protein
MILVLRLGGPAESFGDPARFREDLAPAGFVGHKVSGRAVPGHEYGLRLTAEDKAALTLPSSDVVQSTIRLVTMSE